MDTRAPVTVEDALTGEWFPGDWLIRQNMHTQTYLSTTYTVENLLLPAESFLATIILAVWGNPDDWRTILFAKHGYPVKITTHIADQVETWLCVLKRPTSHEMSLHPIIRCKIGLDDVTPLRFCEVLETWRDVHVKERENA